MRMTCPHCNEFSYTRTSMPLTNTSRETIFACRNVQCGHVFSAVTEINRTISPSAIPNPTVILPMSSHVKRNALRRQLDTVPASDVNFDRHEVEGDSGAIPLAKKIKERNAAKREAAR